MTDLRDRLKGIKTFPSLVKFLRDELDWPIDSTDDFEDLTFDYTPEELGIDAASAAKIEEIKRLRPLAHNQPITGIFFVKFEPKQLPVVALRRILNRVVVKKRATGTAAEQQRWATDDLLFISAYGGEDERRISFAHFSQDPAKGDLPTLKVLAWDEQDTGLHLDDVAQRLVEHLSWPSEADEWDDETWRERWSSAFELRHREVVTTSKALAIRLAELARAIRVRINAVLAIETDEGPVTGLMNAFHEALVHDLEPDDFADMYAQTIAYGLLSARVANPTGDGSAEHLPVTNPFLKELMETFLHVGVKGRGPGVGIDFDELGVNGVVQLLDNANIEAVVRDFGDKNPLEDPVIHFYELFLKEYDAKKRMKRGVFYTPRPVVSYIVRSVHQLLQTEFGLANGLADTGTWGEMVERHDGLSIPEGAKPTDRFVTILDPATGTGTFLVEVIEVIHRTLVEGWETAGHGEEEILDLWNDYVPDHLLPRLHGYELMMAPYAIAHLKIGLKLFETGYRFGSDERARVYLTNTLEPAQDFSGQFEFAIPALAHEAEAVNNVKRERQFTVVVGNPPYAKSSSNRSGYAEELVAGYKRLVEGETNVQPLSDDYVKFVAFALKASVPSASIIALITNRSYLDGLIHRGIRQTLVATCSGLSVVDLHGDTNVGEDIPSGRANENVFDIMQGVAITILIRARSGGTESVLHSDLWGTREEKYLSLGGGDVQSGNALPVSSPYFFFSPKNLDSQAEQVGWPSVQEIFSIGGMGVKSRRDHFLIDEKRATLQARFTELVVATDVEELRPTLRVTDNPQWTLHGIQQLVRREGVDERLTSIVYRPFDTRFIWYHRGAIERGDARWPTMKHVLPNRLSLLTSRQSANAHFSSVFVARGLSEMKAAESTRGSYAFPLFLADQDTMLADERDHSNLTVSLLGPSIERRTPEEILAYIYAVLHSPTYRSRYAGALEIEFPRIPPDPPQVLSDELCRIGAEIVALHLLESPRVDRFVTIYDGPKSPKVVRVGWSDDAVWLDASLTKKGQPATPGTIAFRGVPEDVWKFHIGGYQICHKWLKDRKGRTLSAADIVHYQKIVVAISETIRLMGEIDEVIEEHGGWPGAFVTSETGRE